jgi:hypothetical protein
MGGSIGVTIRDPRGKEYRMCRWTNSLSSLYHSMGQMAFPIGHHSLPYLEIGLQVFRILVVAPESGLLIPIEYGLVIVDMKNDVILSCQGYNSPEYWHHVGNVADKDDTKALRELIENNRVKKCFVEPFRNVHKKPWGIVGPTPYQTPPKEELLAVLGPDYMIQVELDTSPFKIINVEEHDYRTLREEVLKLGFKLTAKERAIWNKEIKESEEYA